MNMLGNLNRGFFFCVGENKYPRMFIVHVWNIFFGFFFFVSEKKIHACLKTQVDFFYLIWKIGKSPHKSYEHTWFFFNFQIGIKSFIRAFSVARYEDYITHYPKKKRYTVRTVNCRRKLRVDLTLSAGSFICSHLTVKQQTQELLCMCKYKRNSYKGIFLGKTPPQGQEQSIFSAFSLSSLFKSETSKYVRISRNHGVVHRKYPRTPYQFFS